MAGGRSERARPRARLTLQVALMSNLQTAAHALVVRQMSKRLRRLIQNPVRHPRRRYRRGGQTVRTPFDWQRRLIVTLSIPYFSYELV